MKKQQLLATVLALVICASFLIGLMPQNVYAAKKTNLSKCTVTVKNMTFTGKSQAPTITVKYKNTTLKANKDYKIGLKNADKCGTATCILTGIGKYTGKVTKTFKVLPQKVKKIRYEVESYSYDNGDEEIEPYLFWEKVPGITGYIVYTSDSKNGDYIEYARVNQDIARQFAPFASGTYVKIKAFAYVNGKYYYGKESDSYQIKTNIDMDRMSEIKVTNSDIKAPENPELVYTAPTLNGGTTLPETICVKFVNKSSVAVKHWYYELIDSIGNLRISGSWSLEVGAGETVYLPIGESLVYEASRGGTIKKVLVCGVDAGADGWASSPDNPNSDDTFGEAVVIDCNINMKKTIMNDIKMTIGMSDWDEREATITDIEKKYNEFVGMFSSNWNYDTVSFYYDNDKDNYKAYVNDYFETELYKDCLATCMGYGCEACLDCGDNEFNVYFDAYPIVFG